MRLRRTSIRWRVFLLILVPLLGMAGIYAFAVANQFSTAVGLANTGKVTGATVNPVRQATQALAAERQAAVAFLTTHSDPAESAWVQQQHVTDAAAAVVTSVSKSGPVTANATALEKSAAAKFVRALGGLPALRSEIARRQVAPLDAINAYSAIMDDAVTVVEQGLQEHYMALPLAATSSAEVELYSAAMIASQEFDIYSASQAPGQGGMTPREEAEFTQLAGLRTYLVQDATPQLDAEASGMLRQYVPATLSASLAAQEKSIIGAGPGAANPVAMATWQQTAGGYVKNMTTVMTRSPAWIQAQVVTQARHALTTLIVAAGAGLLVLLLSIVISLLMGRRLVRRLTGLRQSALELAHERLPALMTRLRRGDPVDVDAEAPPAQASADEIDQVRQAFGVVHRTAVEAAVDQANLRRGVNDIFRNLARRNQALLHRQLGLLDGMERRAEEPEQLEDLFRVDHLTTRMRRHAEGLIILSGDSPGRTWSAPVPFVDVLRAAAAEVEDYTRVQVEVLTRTALAGHALADVVHLLAELIENATVFSPQTTTVTVTGELVGRGFAVEVEDRGLGLSADRLAEINASLAEEQEFDLAESDRLGLFITGRLAHRHDITVTLRSSAYGGTTAIVIIPSALVVPAGDDSPSQPLAAVGAAREPAGLRELSAGSSDGDILSGRSGGASHNGHNGHSLSGDILSGRGNAASLSDHNGDIRRRQPRHAARPEVPEDSGWRTEPDPASPYPATGEAGPAADGELPGAADSVPNGGLPVRVRQASLAPQLRDGGPAGGASALDAAPPAPADQVRSTMSALQRGWERGRSAGRWPPAGSDGGTLGG